MRHLDCHGRDLLICRADAELGQVARTGERLIVLVPADSPAERQRAEQQIRHLAELGCVELCCIGAEAELLHDALDWILVDIEPVVVTSADVDVADGCWYFLFAAGGRDGRLVALVEERVDVVETLVRLCAAREGV